MGCSYTLPSLWESAVHDWVVWLTLAGARPSTLRLRRGHVRMVALRSATSSPQELTLAMIIQIASANRWSNEHRKGLRSSLNSFFDHCVNNEIVSANPAADLPKVPPERARPRLATDEI
jgi:hypothetical protein